MIDFNLKDLCEILLNEEDSMFISVKKLFNLVIQEKEDFKMEYNEFIEFLKQEDNLFEIIDIPFDLDINLNNNVSEDFIFQNEPPFICIKGNFDEKMFKEFLKDKIDLIIESVEALFASKIESNNLNEFENEKYEDILQRAYTIKNKLL